METPSLRLRDRKVQMFHQIFLSNRDPDDQYTLIKENHPNEWAAYSIRMGQTHLFEITESVYEVRLPQSIDEISRNSITRRYYL